MKLYPKATVNRLPRSDPAVKPIRNRFLKAAGRNFLLLQILFLGLFSYVFGSLFQQTQHTHNIRIGFVDYDGGAIGQAVRSAYGKLQGASFPTLEERSTSQFATPSDLQDAVCQTEFWATLYTSLGASARLEAALAGGSAAASYNKSDVLTYIWNEALYSTVVDQVVSANLLTLTTAARVAYSIPNGTGQVQGVTDAAALAVLVDPWELIAMDIQPTSQGSRAIYNTLVIILLLIQEFFYLGTINSLYQAMNIYVKMPPPRIIVYRTVNSLSYTMVGSLCTVAAIWAFKAGWHVNGSQFALSWVAVWLFAHLNFVTLDVFTIWLPPPYQPMALISWVVFNVTSILLPFQLSPAFYRIGYAAPAHEVYQVLTDIWSRGCNPQLRYALPIMFTWEVLGYCLSALGVYRRCHYATLAAEEQERQFQARLDIAMEFEHREKELREAEPTEEISPDEIAPERPARKPSTVHTGRDETDTELREELSRVLSNEDERLRVEQRRASKGCSFGPSFGFAFGGESSDSESEPLKGRRPSAATARSSSKR